MLEILRSVQEKNEFDAVASGEQSHLGRAPESSEPITNLDPGDKPSDAFQLIE